MQRADAPVRDDGSPPARDSHAPADASERVRIRAAATSLGIGVLLLGAKFVAWGLTDSQTVFSDAMESIVNVAAAATMLAAIRFAARPADESHPYGHGKIEFLIAGFEGGLIAFAGIAIVYEAVAALVEGSVPRELDLGIAIVGGAGVVNLLLGLFLVRTGRRNGSPALEADGRHVISDFQTSAGAVAGLLLVRVTGVAWIDPATAILVATSLFWTGAKLMRQAARGLLDESDPDVIDDLAAALEAAREPGIIEIHDLRAINVGDRRHVDLHVVVPEFLTVDEAHTAMDRYEARVRGAGSRAELQYHVDPCERAYCTRCDVTECAVRAAPFTERTPFSGTSVVRGPSPASARAVHEDPRPRPLPD